MGKKKLVQKTRSALILLLSALVILSGLMTILFGIIGFQVDKSVILDSYSTTSDIKYDVTFFDHPLYNSTELEFGTDYVTSFVDKINMTFLYSFDCKNAKDIKGVYSVTGLVEANYNGTILVWKKEYPLLQNISFSSGQAVGAISLPISEYRDLVTNIENSTNVKTQAKMTINFTVNASAEIDGKPVTETSNSTLNFNINNDILTLGGEPINEQTKEVTETVQQDLLPKNTVLFTGIPLFVIFAGALVYILFFTIGVKPDPVDVELKKIYKKYSSRIIELRSDQRQTQYETIQTRTFRDLLLIADELKKPIFKNSSSEYKDTEFHVVDGSRKYTFRARDIEIEINKPEKSVAHTK